VLEPQILNRSNTKPQTHCSESETRRVAKGHKTPHTTISGRPSLVLQQVVNVNIY